MQKIAVQHARANSIAENLGRSGMCSSLAHLPFIIVDRTTRGAMVVSLQSKPSVVSSEWRAKGVALVLLPVSAFSFLLSNEISLRRALHSAVGFSAVAPLQGALCGVRPILGDFLDFGGRPGAHFLSPNLPGIARRSCPHFRRDMPREFNVLGHAHHPTRLQKWACRRHQTSASGNSRFNSASDFPGLGQFPLRGTSTQ